MTQNADSNMVESSMKVLKAKSPIEEEEKSMTKMT